MNSFLTNNKYYLEDYDSESIDEEEDINYKEHEQEIKKLDNFDNINNDEEDLKYIQPIILEKFELEKYFSREDIKKSLHNNIKLKITDKGLYSISKYDDARWITDIIIKLIEFLENKSSKNLTVVDATAGIGGNTVDFAKLFKKVIAIEINDVHYEVLKNNLKALSLKNVEVINENFLFVLDKIKDSSDIFFLDPPWGGKNYKNFKFFNLKIGKIYIYSIINILYSKKYKYVILKAPFNLNISPLISSVKYHNLNIYKNNKQTMLIAIFY